MFGRINELQEAVVQAGKNIGLSAEEIQRLTEVGGACTCTCQ